MPEQLEVTVPMKDASPGPVTLEIYQFGLEKPDRLPLTAYAEAAALDRLTLSAGDAQAQLKGNRLDEVAKVSLGSITWTPAALSRVQDFDQLELSTGSSTAALEPGKRYFASVQLQDGRLLRVPVSVKPPRPQVTLLSKGAGRGLRHALAGASGQPRRPARRRAAGLLSARQRAGKLFPR
jgi:hypothetical protein